LEEEEEERLSSDTSVLPRAEASEEEDAEP